MGMCCSTSSTAQPPPWRSSTRSGAGSRDDRRQAERRLVEQHQAGFAASARPSASICCSPRRAARRDDRRGPRVPGSTRRRPPRVARRERQAGVSATVSPRRARVLRARGRCRGEPEHQASVGPDPRRRGGSCPSGRTMPETALSIMVFPAPFGPRRPTTSPAPTWRSRLRSAGRRRSRPSAPRS